MSLGEQLAEFALCPASALGASAREAARRTLVNAVAVAVGGSGSPPSALVLAQARRFRQHRQATIIGHEGRVEARVAALVNGVSAHVEDFDDTHMATIVHPGAAVVPAALAAAELEEASGEDLVAALAVGVEIALRVGLGLYPAAFDTGWHMSGLAGPVGAAAAAGRVLGLDRPALRCALDLAAAQAAGTQEALGTMTKPLHLGKAAANGLEAALLARAGLSVPAEAPDGTSDLLAVFAGDQRHPAAVTDGLGQRWEIESNSFKPYACGVVSHAAIDAGVSLRGAGCDWRHVARARVRTNPVVLDVMGVKAPRDELQAKFSVYHCVAVALRYGGAAPAQFRDEVVRDPELVSLRERVEVELDGSCAVEEAELTVMLSDGTRQSVHITDALGTPLAPLSDDDLRAKARLTAEERLGTARTEALIDALFAIEECTSIAALLALSCPLPAPMNR